MAETGAVKVRADKVQPGDTIKVGPLWFDVESVERIPFGSYPVLFICLNLSGGQSLIHYKYTLVTITEGSTNHGTHREADSRPQF